MPLGDNMLSKAVKLRRRINRELRKQPHWRTCMQFTKQHQIDTLKLQFNSTYGAHPPFFRTVQPPVSSYLEERTRLKTQLRTMTQQEFYDELRVKHSAMQVCNLRFWAQMIAARKIELQDEMRKARRK
jgi:hypothetical protein